jgi:thioredoxin 1
MLTPVLEKLSEKPDLAIAKVDIDANVELGARHNIQSVPSLLLFKNGELIDRKFGARPGAEIEAWVRSHM